MKFILQLFDNPFWALVRKEINQILRDKQLIVLLIVPPTVQLLLYGFALNPDVHNLKLGVIDYANVVDSRELISAMTSNRIFTLESVPTSEKELSQQVEEGKLDVGVIIPPDFPRKLAQKTAEIQVFIDAVNANTAGIAANYMNQIVQQYNLSLEQGKQSPPVSPQVVFLYNPGLTSSWFFVPGVMGLVLTLIGTLVSFRCYCCPRERYRNFGTIVNDSSRKLANIIIKNCPFGFLANGGCHVSFNLGNCGI